MFYLPKHVCKSHLTKGFIYKQYSTRLSKHSARALQTTACSQCPKRSIPLRHINTPKAAQLSAFTVRCNGVYRQYLWLDDYRVLREEKRTLRSTGWSGQMCLFIFWNLFEFRISLVFLKHSYSWPWKLKTLSPARGNTKKKQCPQCVFLILWLFLWYIWEDSIIIKITFQCMLSFRPPALY